MICFLWCYDAKLNWKVLQTVSPNSVFPETNWRREISLLVNSLMANNLRLKNHSEQGIESAFAGRCEKQFFYYSDCLNMKPTSANALSFARLCIVISCFWGIRVTAPELGLSCSAGCTKTSALGGELVKLIWWGHALNPIWFGGCQPPSQGLRASLCQIIIHSLKPSPRHGSLIHPFQRESRVWIMYSLLSRIS